AVGDLHFAGDNFAGAIEEYRVSLRALGPDAPHDRCRVLEKIATAEMRRGEFESALRPLRDAREVARPLRDSRLNAGIAARLANVLSNMGRYAASRRLALYAYAVLRDSDDHRTVGPIAVTL